MKNFLTKMAFVIIYLVLIICAAWLHLPALNIHDFDFGLFILCSLLPPAILFYLKTEKKSKFYTASCLLIGVCIASVFFMIIALLGSTAIFNAYKYADIANYSEQSVSIVEELPNITNKEKLLVIDPQNAERLGDRTIGGIKNAAWYEVGDYTLIKYQDNYFWTAPLEYGGLFKYLKAKHEGIPGYVMVNATTGDSQFVELNNPIQYSPTGYFSEYLKRHIRFKYPTKLLFKDPYFEIDEKGTPYFITPINTVTIGLYGGKKQQEVIITNACTGESEFYSNMELPEWVDNACYVDNLMARVSDRLKYQKGFLNTIFSKTGVRALSYDYRNSITSEDDEEADTNFTGFSYLVSQTGETVIYTGVTPANRAESNLGFVLINPRTGEAKYYDCVGAEESSAQNAAEGLVQNLGYEATYPSIINIDGEETYFMCLKDNAGLVQRYALCNIKNYTKVVQAETLEQALNLYRQKLGTSSNVGLDYVTTKTGVIKDIFTAQIDGYTYYMYLLEDDEILYMSSITNSNRQVLLNVGDEISINFIASSEEGVCLITEITFR